MIIGRFNLTIKNKIGEKLVALRTVEAESKFWVRDCDCERIELDCSRSRGQCVGRAYPFGIQLDMQMPRTSVLALPTANHIQIDGESS